MTIHIDISSKNKGVLYFSLSAFIAVIYFVCHDHIANIIMPHIEISILGKKAVSQTTMCSIAHNVVTHTIWGIALLLFIESIQYFIISFFKNDLVFLILRCVAVFTFMDVIFQNLRGSEVTIFTFSMTYQAMGGCAAVILFFIVRSRKIKG